MGSAKCDPELATDTATVILESAFKTALSERSAEYENGEDLAKIIKDAVEEFKLELEYLTHAKVAANQVGLLRRISLQSGTT